jgi:gamma-glutamyltranspeptidase
MKNSLSVWRSRTLSGVAALAASALVASAAHALDRSIVGLSGMVVAGHPLAAQAGIKVLKAGGTACDAAVAASAVLSIAMTDMMGPGGLGLRAAVGWAEKGAVVDRL